MALGCGYILAMTVICWVGIELSARTQFVLLAAEIVILIGFSIFALVNVFLNHPAGSVTPSWSWMNPFELTASQLSQGVLLALFIYWGWDTAANVNEETRGARTTSGVATVASTIRPGLDLSVRRLRDHRVPRARASSSTTPTTC